MTDPVHSTADVNAVSHVDKFGNSMPILKTTSYPGQYSVYHEGVHKGYVQELHGHWYSHHDYLPGDVERRITEHPHRHAAVRSLFE